MYVYFEIAALFPSPYSRVNKRGNFKTNIHLDFVESFLYRRGPKNNVVQHWNFARRPDFLG